MLNDVFFTDIDWQPVIFYYKGQRLFISVLGKGLEYEVTDDSPDEILCKAKKAREKLSIPDVPAPDVNDGYIWYNKKIK